MQKDGAFVRLHRSRGRALRGPVQICGLFATKATNRETHAHTTQNPWQTSKRPNDAEGTMCVGLPSPNARMYVDIIAYPQTQPHGHGWETERERVRWRVRQMW